MATPLVEEAEKLLNQLHEAMEECFREVPSGRMAKEGTGKRRMRLRRLIGMAKRRIVLRKIAAGHNVPVAGAMWVINNKGSEFF